jgi:hypothetical protein
LDSNDEQEDENDENDEEDEESGSDEDDENSRSATPDLTKLTKRQRAAFEEDPALMALSNEAQKKKHLTDEEHVQRRAEMARRRKNLSEKRNEEEKVGHAAFLTLKDLRANPYIRWKRSTSFYRSRLRNDELELRSQQPMPPSILGRKTKKVDRNLICCMSDGSTTRMGAGLACRRNGYTHPLVMSSSGREG